MEFKGFIRTYFVKQKYAYKKRFVYHMLIVDVQSLNQKQFYHENKNFSCDFFKKKTWFKSSKFAADYFWPSITFQFFSYHLARKISISCNYQRRKHKL